MSIFEKDMSVAKTVSAEALELADRHGTPPAPPAYEIWFTYVSGENAELNRVIDAELAQLSSFSPADVRRIHQRFFSTRQLEVGVTTISDEICDSLDEVTAKVSESADDTVRFAGVIGNASKRLAKTKTVEDVLRTAATMAAASDEQVARSQALRQELERLNAQVKSLKSNLGLLMDQAFTDHLTKVKNRRYFDEELEPRMTQAKNKEEPLCLAVGDLDHFKSINDNWGHAAGDFVLRKFAQMMITTIKGGDIVARLGGEEFALLLPNTPLKGAFSLVNRIRENLASARLVTPLDRSRPKRVTVSFGVTAMRPDDDAVSFLNRADALLYDAKGDGRNAVRCSA